MSSSKLAISVHSLSKCYRISKSNNRPTTLAEQLIQFAKDPLKNYKRDEFWALRDINVEIEQGEIVGLIGKNGAGKSTLLKILSKITDPTEGEAYLYGRVGSLLEVGSGFHPELTGRENIFLSGALLGMSRGEIKSCFDAIVDFAGIDQFLETPVKRYSSGMYVRLAFAVAAHLRSEILLVDEVLAVGDMEFQKKCLGKIKDVSGDGRTVLLVSHNLHSISTLCTRGIVLSAGQVVYSGDVSPALDKYIRLLKEQSSQRLDSFTSRDGSGQFRIEEFSPVKPLFDGDEKKEFAFRIRKKSDVGAGSMALCAYISNERGVVVAQCDSRLTGCWLADNNDVIEGKLEIDSLWLKPGTYRVSVRLFTPNETVDSQSVACVFDVSPTLTFKYAADGSAVEHGVIFTNFNWHIQPPPHLVSSRSTNANELIAAGSELVTTLESRGL
ncbi:MAG TPA: polysaccharide ABC transporter ATP-binding protein [Planktothrix sp.]|jgi:lipopolysaccharide transport system ATP-binding protein